MQNQRFRVVLDTNQIVGAGSGWLEYAIPCPEKNTCRRILMRVAQDHIGLYTGKIVGEYLEKLVDIKHPRDRALKFITYIMGAFLPVAITTKSAPFCPSDPDDEIFLLCAIDGDADYLISEDNSLVNLKSNYGRPIIGRSGELLKDFGA